MNVTCLCIYQFPNLMHCIVPPKTVTIFNLSLFQDHFHCTVTYAAKSYYYVASPPALSPYGLAVSLLLLTVLVN